MFMRDGTPSGFSTMSTGEPSAMYGMSSSGRIREITPLLPWRPAILSPTESLRLMARYTFTILNTPGGSSSPLRSRAIFSSNTALITLAWSSIDAKIRSICSWARASSSWMSFQRLCGTWASTSAVIAVRGSIQVSCLRSSRDAVRGALAGQHLAHLVQRALADDPDLVVLVLAQPVDLGLFDRARALVLLDAAPREHLRADHRARDSGRHAQRRVAHVAGLLAEDRAQQPLLGRELGLALRRDLADQHVVLLHLGADPHDARLVEVLERLLADVRDVARDVLLAELRVARDALELLDVDRGVGVVLDHALGDQDRVFEVVPAPGHERDEHVAPERELAALGGRTVRDHLPAAAPASPASRSASG